jgi:hypothetical protein
MMVTLRVNTLIKLELPQALTQFSKSNLSTTEMKEMVALFAHLDKKIIDTEQRILSCLPALFWNIYTASYFKDKFLFAASQ